jgi:N-carbamoyl-L-amino-acid hydrolase
MRPNLKPDTDLAARLFATLHEATFDGVGITREAYGPGERVAHAIVRAEAEALGLEIAVDPAGNLLMTLPGEDRAAPCLVIGSHLDSVPKGGNYDGAAGVLAGLAMVAGMQRAGVRPARDVVVLAVRAEEGGAWFPTSFPGSRAALGTLPPAALETRRLDSGRTLAEHMAEEGFDPEAVRAGRCLLPPARVAAYVELHIEQGPVLEAEGLPVGIVTGIPGSRRLRDARVIGEYNHSGATPRRFRRDAAVALAELAHRLDDCWAELEHAGHSLVATFCVMGTTAEAGFTKIPGEARFQLDVRSEDPASIEAIYAALAALVAEIEARRGVRFELGTPISSPPTPMDQGVQRALAAAARAVGVPCRMMPSGGGHDAVAFAQVGVPTGMLFVRNQNGSHNPREAMRMEDFDAAAAVILRWAAEAAGMEESAG